MKSDNNTKKIVLDKVQSNQSEEAIQILMKISKKSGNNTNFRELVLLLSNLSQLKSDDRKGVISLEESRRTKNRINNAILEINNNIDIDNFRLHASLNKEDKLRGTEEKLGSYGCAFIFLGLIIIIPFTISDLFRAVSSSSSGKIYLPFDSPIVSLPIGIGFIFLGMSRILPVIKGKYSNTPEEGLQNTFIGIILVSFGIAIISISFV